MVDVLHSFDYVTTKIAGSPWNVDLAYGEADTARTEGKPRFITPMEAAKLTQNYVAPAGSVMELTRREQRALGKISHQVIGGNLFVNGKRYSMCNGD